MDQDKTHLPRKMSVAGDLAGGADGISPLKVHVIGHSMAAGPPSISMHEDPFAQYQEAQR
jgi:hypothetical protein